ncbi:hypothetical protein [Candidatus Protochlamydia phocaeensis]|uniref:hypothetical protein n=1 Tax=Candidatus Protochlamydia phocaeensis TaxID=1414722 RepID=UPI0008397DB7|nr:hypothetical protein [Candidatus Protochlamydia phocaeensis]
MGTDFELALEEAERKVNVSHPTPVLLLDSSSYWEKRSLHAFIAIEKLEQSKAETGSAPASFAFNLQKRR